MLSQNALSVVIEQEGPSAFQYRNGERSDLDIQFNELSLIWAPHSVVEIPPGTAGAAETLTVVVLVSASITFLMRKFFESFTAEAGKDAYASLKKFIATMAARNRAKTYRLNQSFYLVANVGDQHVIIPFTVMDNLHDDLVHKLRINTASEDERKAAMAVLFSDSETQIDQVLCNFKDAWPAIEATIREFEVGDMDGPGVSPSGFHILERINLQGRLSWTINAVSSNNDWKLPDRFRARRGHF